MYIHLKSSSSQSFLAHLNDQAVTCGYANYMEEFVTFPPKGLLPLPGGTTHTARGCDLWDEIFDAALVINPAFDIYRIFDTVCGQSQQSHAIVIYMDSNSSRSYGTFLVSRKCTS